MIHSSSPKQSSADLTEETSRSGSTSQLPAEAKETTLVFSCRCSNVTVSGRLAGVGDASSEVLGNGKESVELSKGAEKAKHPIYVGYDAPEPERKSRRPSHSGDVKAPEVAVVPVWRVCWMCDTKLYQVGGKRKGDEAVEEGLVAIDRHGGIVIQSSTSAEIPAYQPYSNLSLLIPRSSNFGRPPQKPLVIYPSPSSPSSRPTTHLPLFPDPFFLPPPFIPSHPHLRELCANAVDYLTACHSASEVEVKNYIDIKAQEMRNLEEKVRAEVEMMWDKYVQGPGREDVRERERRRSESVGTSVDRKGKGRDRRGFANGNGNGNLSGISTSPSPSVDNPIMREAALATFPTGASLLSASISQMSYMPRPAPVADSVDDTIDELARTYDKQGDQRAMAMSYVFSNMDGAISGNPNLGKSAQPPVEEVSAGPELHGRDSWVDEERTEAWRRERRAGNATGKENGEEKVVKASALVGSSTERRGSEGRKAKGHVSFEEPISEVTEDEPSATPSEDDDYVFDFELEDRTPSAHPTTETATELARRQHLDASFSSTYASNAPSHRTAHQRLLAGGKDNYTPFRRRIPDSSTGEDESKISQLATSVPMPIGFRGSVSSTPRAAPYAFERKTSLSDRQGLLVPPLMRAMRQRGVGVGDGMESGAGNGDQAQVPVPKVAFKADPGVVLESMAADEDDDGTPKERGFVPPHVLARKESMQSGDVGWRSMISES